MSAPTIAPTSAHTSAQTHASPAFAEIDRPFARITEVADGIIRFDTPVPFRGLRQVNVWLIRDGDGWTQVDCGYGEPRVQEALEEAWRTVLGGKSVTRLIVTHFHPDHSGNCRYISERWNVRPHMTQLEWMCANLAVKDSFTDDIASRARFYARNGAAPEKVAQFDAEVLPYSDGVALPEAARRIADRGTLQIGGDDWHILTGGGHSPDLAGLYCPKRKVYISGDQLLPKITTNVSVWQVEPEADPLGEFMASLERMEERVGADFLVLPSHGDPFQGPNDRIAVLREHHHARLDTVREAIRAHGGTASAGDCLAAMFSRPLDGHQLGFAMGEAIAHLNHLVVLGEAERLVGTDGITRFRLRDR
jgi:glyoxylase-like metal-dependent hydrolase (beta-lactamase superfamily II)